MIKIVEMAFYILQKYKIIGLFFSLSNILINYENQKDFKLINFFGGIKIDDEGVYLDGISPFQINEIDKNFICPPEIY
jgi:hypothetical protein